MSLFCSINTYAYAFANTSLLLGIDITVLKLDNLNTVTMLFH